MGRDSFWDVYNQLRDAVDSEMLFESGNGAVNEDDDVSEVPDAIQPPLQHLQPCEFGKNGIPPGHYGGRADPFLPFCCPDSISCPELLEDDAGFSDGASGMVVAKLVFTQVLMFFLKDDIAVPFSDQEGDYELY